MAKNNPACLGMNQDGQHKTESTGELQRRPLATDRVERNKSLKNLSPFSTQEYLEVCAHGNR